jgi:hypothetical protein
VMLTDCCCSMPRQLLRLTISLRNTLCVGQSFGLTCCFCATYAWSALQMWFKFAAGACCRFDCAACAYAAHHRIHSLYSGHLAGFDTLPCVALVAAACTLTTLAMQMPCCSSTAKAAAATPHEPSCP